MTAASETIAVDDYKYEKNRLNSFQLWPCPNIIHPVDLAKCGFYSTGFYMETQCNWCHTTISDWQPDDQIMARHRRGDPFCQFILNPHGCGNVPLQSHRNGGEQMRENFSSTSSSNSSSSSSSSNISNSNNGGINCTANGEATSGEQRQLQQNEDSQNGMIDAPQPDLTIESNRLATFKNWPNTNVSPQSLAKAGFYYFNKSDHVRCYWCKGVIGKWEKGDNAFQEHDKFFPDCPRVHLGPFIEITNESVSLDGMRDLGIQQICPPKTAKYSCLDARMRTYSRWPIPDIQRPEVLAQAGFYYKGVEDHVQCFHCNGGLRSWQEEDDPWFEHAKWFPNCNFLQLVKGPTFVSQIRGVGRQQQSHVAEAERKHANDRDSECDRNVENNSVRTIASGRVCPSISLDDAMQTEPVHRALEMGLNEGRILNATRRHLETHGKPFDTIEELVEAVLEGQVEEEEESNGPEPSSSIVREVSRILNNIFNPRNQSNLPDGGDYDYEDITDFHGPGEGSSTVLPSFNQSENLNYSNNQPSMGTSSTSSNTESQRATPATGSTRVNTRTNSSSSSSKPSNLTRDNSIGIEIKSNEVDATATSSDSSDNSDTKNQSKIRPKLNEQISLEEENRKLKDARTCKICMDEDVGVVFLPCGHLVTCVQCAPGVTVCPLCRSAIKGFVRTFLS